MSALLRSSDGGVTSLDTRRWWAEPDATERALLDRLPDPVLDIGCGPGRVPAALARLGRTALGIDPAPHAVAQARRRGGRALRRSVFNALPAEGRWAVTLLLDGNVGIGGDPAALLRRCRELVRPGGVVLAELLPPGTQTRTMTARVEWDGGSGPWFRWARVGADDWSPLAERAGWSAPIVDHTGDRWFGRAVAS